MKYLNLTKTLLISLTCLLTLLSCKKDNIPGSMHIRENLKIVFLNKSGQNLVDPLTVNRLQFEKMRLFFLENNEKIEVYNPMLDSPRGLHLNDKEAPYFIAVSANISKGEVLSDKNGIKTGQSTALLQLNDSITDTIKTEWQSGPGYVLITKTWYNGILVYDVANPQNGIENGDGFKITKSEF